MVKTQSDELLDYLMEGNTITSREAFRKFGITRLSARIYDLRSKGIKIESKMVTVRNRHGGKTQVTRYWIA